MTDPSPTLFGMPTERGRWVFVLLGLVINLAIGSIYAWSVFRKPLEAAFAVGATESLFPFTATWPWLMRCATTGPDATGATLRAGRWWSVCWAGRSGGAKTCRRCPG